MRLTSSCTTLITAARSVRSYAGPSRLSPAPHRPLSSSAPRQLPSPTSILRSGVDASRPAPRRPRRSAPPPPLEAASEGAAGEKGQGKATSVIGSWKALAPNTRIALGMGLATFAVLGILTADKLEATMPVSEKERRADGSKPRLLGVSVVERRKDEGEKVV